MKYIFIFERKEKMSKNKMSSYQERVKENHELRMKNKELMLKIQEMERAINILNRCISDMNMITSSVDGGLIKQFEDLFEEIEKN